MDKEALKAVSNKFVAASLKKISIQLGEEDASIILEAASRIEKVEDNWAEEYRKERGDKQ